MERKPLEVADGHVVRIHYTLTIGERLLDRTDPDQPLSYVQGAGQLVRGLEAALAGRIAGDHFAVHVAAADGYGEVAPGGPQPIPRSVFPMEMDLYPGLLFLGEGRSGDHLPLWIVGIEGETVLVQASHPHAGRQLDFDVTIVDVHKPKAAGGSHD